MLALRRADVPERLGEPKHGALAGLFAYRVNDSSRILYHVNRANGVCKVTLLRVCNHKDVYDKD